MSLEITYGDRAFPISREATYLKGVDGGGNNGLPSSVRGGTSSSCISCFGAQGRVKSGI